MCSHSAAKGVKEEMSMISNTLEDEGQSHEKFATPGEARLAIENLTKTEHTKLALIAHYFAVKRLRGTTIEAADLLQDAFTKTLDGTRRWNKSVSIIRHLDRTMESDSGHIAEQAAKQEIIPLSDNTSEVVHHEPNASTVSEQLEQILNLFTDDNLARQVLMLKSQGYTAAEIQQTLNIDKKKYETTTKRIRRRVVKYLKDGGPLS